MHSIDKANVLETSRQRREIVHRVHAKDHSDIELHDQLVDSCAMQLIAAPTPRPGESPEESRRAIGVPEPYQPR